MGEFRGKKGKGKWCNYIIILIKDSFYKEALHFWPRGRSREATPPNPSDICCGLDECLPIAHVVRFGLQHMVLMRNGGTFEWWVTES